MKSKKPMVLLIMLLIASIFIIGPSDWLGDPGKKMYHSYFADFAIPFGYYFLLILMEDQVEFLQKWQVKASAVFLLCATSELLQYFGIYALASVFDPLDILVYALGASTAALVDRKIFTRVFGFWE